MNQWTNTNDGGTPPPSDPAAAAAAGGNATTTLLQQPQPGDWLPEKHRVFKEGTQELDLEASNRKLGDAYRSLEQRAGQGGLVPKTAAEYKLENLGEGISIDEVKADPLFKGVLDRAHAAGISNESLQFFMQDYFTNIAPNLFAANAQLTLDEARAELGKVWADDITMTKNLGLAARAAKGFGAEGDAPGSFDRLMQRYGNDPDFLAFAAKVGAEMQEDQPIDAGTPAAQDWDDQANAIRAHEAYMNKDHPEHAKKVRELEALYQRRYGTKQQSLGASAVR